MNESTAKKSCTSVIFKRTAYSYREASYAQRLVREVRKEREGKKRDIFYIFSSSVNRGESKSDRLYLSVK